MKRSFLLLLVAATALVSGALAPKRAEAIPAFARQTGVPCYSCHYQFVPQLSQFGRDFKLGGMTQSAQELLQDEGLSMPPVLNASVKLGSAITLGSTGGPNGNNPGNWDVARDASLHVGGRVGQDIGALIELGGQTSPNFDNMKIVYSHNFGMSQGGLVVYRSAKGGPAYSMELFNTGPNTMSFGWDSAQDIFINGAAGPESGTDAEGLHFFAGSSLFFLNVGLFAPVGDNLNALGGSGANVGINFSQYYRLAVTPKVADGLDLMIGVQGTTGTTEVKMGGAAPLKIDTQSLTVDAQAQFELAGNQAQVIASWGQVPSKNGAGSNNAAAATTLGCAGATPSPYCKAVYNPGANDISGFDVAFSYSIEKELGVKAMYGSVSNFGGTKFNLSGFGLGAWFDPAQNLTVGIEEVWYSGDTGATQLNHDATSTTFTVLMAF